MSLYSYRDRFFRSIYAVLQPQNVKFTNQMFVVIILLPSSRFTIPHVWHTYPPLFDHHAIFDVQAHNRALRLMPTAAAAPEQRPLHRPAPQQQQQQPAAMPRAVARLQRPQQRKRAAAAAVMRAIAAMAAISSRRLVAARQRQARAKPHRTPAMATAAAPAPAITAGAATARSRNKRRRQWVSELQSKYMEGLLILIRIIKFK